VANGDRRYLSLGEHLDRLTGLYGEVVAEPSEPAASHA
jgi:hypothetical protein